MRGLFFINETLSENSGISKKILYQIEALKKNKVQIYFLSLAKEEDYILRKIDNKIVDKFQNNILGKIKRDITYKNLLNFILKNKIEFIYIRYTHFSNYFFNKFLRKLKANNIKILLEIPTYPYDMEYRNVSIHIKIKLLVEKYYRKKMKNSLERIITFSNDEEIFGVKTIKISNGIDVNKISIINKSKIKEIKETNFIGVAGIAFWHGFDRFILSMAEYYKNNPKEIVKFHIVGDGDKETVNNLKNLVKENQLEDYVIFYGYKSGKELDEIYNKMKVAVGSLGFSRIGLERGAPLKTREYIAKGLPIIIGYEDISLNGSIKFIYKIPNEESLFSIEKIIEWYKSLNITSEEIRKYAVDNLSWDIQMKKVVESIKELM